jgi:hypothetical protein
MGPRGWVYIITNQSMPGLLKVGYSTMDPSQRAVELNHTGSPAPYVVAYDMLVTGPREVERRTHESLKKFHAGKEWFTCTTAEAIAAIRTAAGAARILESSAAVESKSRRSRTQREQHAFPFPSGIKKVVTPSDVAIRCWNCGDSLSDGEATCKNCGKRGPLAK